MSLNLSMLNTQKDLMTKPRSLILSKRLGCKLKLSLNISLSTTILLFTTQISTSSWSIALMEIFKLILRNEIKFFWARSEFGNTFYKYFSGLTHCILKESFIEIWSHWTSFWQSVIRSKLEILELQFE